jgi:hypothetical protein
MSAEPSREPQAHKSYDLKLVVDDSALQSALLELKSYLSRNTVELPHSLSQFVSVDVDRGTTTRTGELRITLKPSDAFMEYMSAARIGTWNI